MLHVYYTLPGFPSLRSTLASGPVSRDGNRSRMHDPSWNRMRTIIIWERREKGQERIGRGEGRGKMEGKRREEWDEGRGGEGVDGLGGWL